MDLVETLTKQHRLLDRLVAELDHATAAGDPHRITGQFLQLRQAVAEHLALEDARLYPELLAYAEEQQQAQMAMLARGFASNMGLISESLLAFFERHAANPTSALMAQEWPAMKSALIARSEAEEKTLFPLHQRAFRRSPGRAAVA